MVPLALEPEKQMIKGQHLYLYLLIICGCFSCSANRHKEEVKNEIFETEKAFEKMAFDESIAEAFYFFADSNAVIKREQDTLISGRDNIRRYYENKAITHVVVKWKPDYIEVAENGDLAYTFGKYSWNVGNNGDTTRFVGIFHTVWKRQKDGSWKYVWD